MEGQVLQAFCCPGQGIGVPQDGFEGHDLASSCCSHQFPAATLGIRPS